MLIDSHCHLNRLEMPVGEALAAARAVGVERCVNVSIDLETWPELVATCERFDGVYATCGLHPTDHVGQPVDGVRLRDYAQHPLVVAIGETGLDYYHCSGDVSWQQARFRDHIRAALALDLPLVVHTRQARQDTIRILQEEGAHKGVLHCFTEDLAMAEKAIELGFYISFSGIITFKNAHELQQVVACLPLERLLVETDAPYLAPVPYRGRSNQPAYVLEVAKKMAELQGVSLAEVAKVTTANTRALFAL